MAGFVLLHQKLQETSEYVASVEEAGARLDAELREAETEALERTRELRRLEDLVIELETECRQRARDAETVQLQWREVNHAWARMLQNVAATLADTDALIDSSMTTMLSERNNKRTMPDVLARSAVHRRNMEALHEHLEQKWRQLSAARETLRVVAEPPAAREARDAEIALLRSNVDEEVENLNSLELCCYTLELENERLEQRHRMFKQQQQSQQQHHTPHAGQGSRSSRPYQPAQPASFAQSQYRPQPSPRLQPQPPPQPQSPKRRRGFQSSLKILLDDLVIPEFKDHW